VLLSGGLLEGLLQPLKKRCFKPKESPDQKLSVESQNPPGIEEVEDAEKRLAGMKAQ
jgi:hypothetical protein